MAEARLGVHMTGRQHFGCNLFASGEDKYDECIMPRAHEAILDYFKLVNLDPGYKNVPQDIVEEDEIGAMSKLEEGDWGFGEYKKRAKAVSDDEETGGVRLVNVSTGKVKTKDETAQIGKELQQKVKNTGDEDLRN